MNIASNRYDKQQVINAATSCIAHIDAYRASRQDAVILKQLHHFSKIRAFLGIPQKTIEQATKDVKETIEWEAARFYADFQYQSAKLIKCTAEHCNSKNVYLTSDEFSDIESFFQK